MSNRLPATYGYNNTASGYNTSAFGSENTTSGEYTTASGNNNAASNEWANAIGVSNTASGYNAVALGAGNTSSGSYSTASGQYNTAAGDFSSAIGYKNNTVKLNSHMIGGWNFGSTGSGSYGAVALGLLNNSQSATISEVGVITGSPTAIPYVGSLSTAVGILNTVSGYYSTALGYQNQATTLNSHMVGGWNFTASGSYASVAFGLLNNALFGGELNWETGTISGTPISGGETGRMSVALGIQNTTSGYVSTAAGVYNSASGSYCVAFGVGNHAWDNDATASGTYNTASNSNANAIGNNNTASGSNSNAIGGSNTASNAGSAAIGFNNNVSGIGALGVGVNNTVAGNNATACGYDNTASQTGANAFGFQNNVSGEKSSAIGCNNTNSGNYSVVIGNSLSNSTDNIVVIGNASLVGTPTAPTATGGTNTTQIATTAFVHTAVSPLATQSSVNTLQTSVTSLTVSVTSKAPSVSPTFTGTPIAPTATFETNTTQLATTAFVQNAFGTIMSLPLPVYAANFSGSNDVLISSTSIASTIGSGDFSIFAWVKTTNSGTDNGIVYIGNSTAGQGVSLMIGPAGTVGCLVPNVGWSAQGVTNVTDGDWHFVGVVVSSGSARIYVDGGTDGSPASISVSLSGTTYLGYAPAYGGLVGDMSETLIFNMELGPIAIEHLYNSGAGAYGVVSTTPWNSNLVAAYHLNNDFTDYSGNNYNGTNEGSVTFVSGFILSTINVAPSWSTILMDTSSVLAIVNLETAVGNAGRVHTIKDSSGNASTNNINIAAYAGQTIDGSESLTISSSYGFAKIQSDGSNWFVIG